MTYSVQQPNLGAVLGAGIGKGLSEQLPIEIERYRLSKGLQNFANQYPNSPLMQQYAQLLSIPGVKESPQLLQTFGDLAKLQAQSQALSGIGKTETPTNPFEGFLPKEISPKEGPDITKREDVQKIKEGYIPPSFEEKIAEAEKLPFFKQDPYKALDVIENKYSNIEKQVAAHEKRFEKTSRLQEEVKDKLKAQQEKLKALNVPSTTFNDVEQKALKEIEEGKTPQEVIQKYGRELDEIARQYTDIDTLGTWGLAPGQAGKSLSSLKSLQKAFKKRGDLRNMAERIVAKNDVSWPTAYAISDRIEDHKKTNKYIKNLPFNTGSLIGSFKIGTEKIIPQLAELIKEEGISPLTVFYHMKQKGYDPGVLKQYLSDNSDKLGLSGFQTDQLGKTVPLIPHLNDLWLEVSGGI